MKLPLSWLAEWVTLPPDPQVLAERLTMAGFEVESLEAAAPPFAGVVVAQILDAAPHPQADKLRVCRVSAGPQVNGGAPLQIVCGAPNVRAGLKSALAVVGATLPGDIAIKAATLRGVESQGMLCSARELGLTVAGEGILELAADAPLGTPLREHLQLDELVIDVAVTPNRGDAMSVLGLAREISALTRKPLPARAFDAVPARIADQTLARVADDAAHAAPRLLTRIIRGVDNRAASPAWLRERLQRSGLRSISPVVDVTNYVLLELGQPMHAYDAAHLRGPLRVRAAQEGESLTLLDGRGITLAADVTVIADDGGPIGLAGIMGGAGTAITADVRDVLLEAAFFAPAALAGRARRHGLQTDASQRFERGVDPSGQERAMERASALIVQIAGGQAGPVCVVEHRDALPSRPAVPLRRARLHRLLGMSPVDADVEAVLSALGMELTRAAEGWSVRPPAHRFDIAIEPDLIEEVVRGLGYESVPEVDASIPQRMRATHEARVDELRLVQTLAARGYQECVTFAFVDPALQAQIFPQQEPLRVRNPIASDLAVLRLSLWPGLLRVALENERRQQPRVRLCELANVFTDGREPRRIAGLASGARWPEQWGVAREAVDFFDIKADVAALLALGGDPQSYTFEPGALACLHPGRAAQVLRAGTSAGWIGELHPALVRALDFTYAPIVFEIDAALLTMGQVPRFQELSRFPHVRRDLSFTLPLATPLSAVRERASVAASSLLRDLRVFDLYQGPGIETGRKSVALGLILQDNYRTLTDDEADAVVARVIADLRATLDARIRE